MKLTLETAKAMYKSEEPSIKQFALDNYTEKELKELEFPKSWKELNVVSGKLIDNDSVIFPYSGETKDFNRNTIPERLAQPILDLIQLLQVRDRYREIEGYDKNCKTRWHVESPEDEDYYQVELKMFSFEKKDTADKFEKNFKEQLESVSKLYR